MVTLSASVRVGPEVSRITRWPPGGCRWLGHRTWFAAFLLSWLLSVPPVLAQTAPEALPGSDVASIRGWLLQHNPELRAMQAEADAAETRIVPAGALPDPMVSMELRDIDPDHPAFLPGNVGSTTYQIRQRVPLWGKRALARDVASGQARATGLARGAAALELLVEAEQAYVRYWHADESTQVIDRLIALLDQVEEIAGVRYALGLAPQQDAIRAQVERTTMQRERIQRQSDRMEASAMLNVALGRRADSGLATPSAMPTLPVHSATLTDALARLDDNGHPSLQASQALAEAAHDAAVLQRRARWPDITLGVGAMQRDDRVESYELMLEVEIPLQRRALHARERESLRMEDAALARTEMARNALAGRLGVAWTQWRAAREKRHLIEKAQLPQSDANFKSALASYQVGEVDFNTLLEALTEWQGADLARVDALRDELLGAAEVRAIEGDSP
ncbi:outer membrane protein TolC [Lysobacter ruishenii]|uniref:Outer membrane protein TolC n=1 Tax=Aerolutibacter ruishenii TaxID=686800 RepID=A0A562LV37_9GAMM|nr:outer membrane protein TolC [Lysobacter ruishenii]